MAFFNKMLASIGVGSAKVDTKLYKSSFSQGETVSGVIEIKGGKTEQYINDIHLSLLTKYVSKSSENEFYETGVISRFRAADRVTIKPDEYKEIPFTFQLPLDSPITSDKTKIWIHTELGIPNALDPSDDDYIEVRPTRLYENILDTLNSLGFYLREVDCEQVPKSIRCRLPFLQEFEYVPTINPFKGLLDELEVSLVSQTDFNLTVLIQVDRKVRGLSSLISEELGLDESNIYLTVNYNDLPNLPNKLFDTINRFSQ